MRGLRRHFEHVLVVDDGSPDDTAGEARRAGAQVMRHAINLGQGAALQTGMAQALRLGAQVVITFDADGQHLPEDALRLAQAVVTGQADVVLGSRFLGAAIGIPPLRRAVLRALVALGRWRDLLLPSRRNGGVRLTDAHNGLRAFSASAARRLRIRQRGMAHASEIVRQARHAGLRIVERPVTVVYTPYSLAKGQRLANGLAIVADLLSRKLER